MPRQFRIATAYTGDRVHFDIKSCRFNFPEAPKESDFTPPETRPWWQFISAEPKTMK